jgi:hypothetical protein
MAGLLDEIKKSQYLQMADNKLQGLLNLRESAQRFMTSPTAFLGLLGQNPLPKESGFAAGATGLPPTEMSVLDPNQAPYMQGYNQGEPVGIAAMALPFAAPAAVMAGKALAPKAGQALESYMVNQGMIQPITTYHASPYKFNAFDPTKVGTGEGAQSYGVGAGYVAQNPRVANEYFKQFTDVEQLPLMYKGKRVDTPWNDEISQRWADVIEKNKFKQEQIEDFQGVLGNLSQVNNMQDVKSVVRDLTPTQKQIYKKYVEPELTKPESLDAYMYKVDVPDKAIPKMLDWDKPLTEQTPEVQEALKKLGISVDKKQLKEFDDALLKALQTDEKVTLPNQPSNPTGAEIYQRLISGSPEATSAKLNESGITGIKYLDAFSRKDTPNQTYNFVPFDPENMKILETTKGLLE